MQGLLKKQRAGIGRQRRFGAEKTFFKNFSFSY